MRHKVKTYNWVSGVLRTREYVFFNLKDAMSFLKSGTHHSVKIFNEFGELVHQEIKNWDMYA